MKGFTLFSIHIHSGYLRKTAIPYIGAVLLFFLFSLPVLATTGAIQLPKTGQTKCYNASGTEIACAGTGQDGEIQAGTAWPNPRFTVGTGTETECIIDNLTGLMWARQGQHSLTWYQALSYATNLSLCGYTDWRLPNLNEMESLVNSAVQRNDNWLISQGFTDVRLGWTSTTGPNGTNCAWNINEYGMVSCFTKSNNSSYSFSALPVRGGHNTPSGIPGMAEVWRTGQTVSYEANDDGDLQMGVIWPSPRFNDNGNGTVKDNLTNLVWTKDANTPGPVACVPGVGKSLQEALAYIKCLNTERYLEYSDWRLPNRKELLSLIDYSEYLPSLPTDHPFINVPEDRHISSNPSLYDNNGRNTLVNIWSGDVIFAINPGRVWPVRGGLVEQQTDNTAPTGIIAINSGVSFTNSLAVTLTPTCTDVGSGCSQMQFSNDNINWSVPETYGSTKSWTLSSGDGTKTVYVKFQDGAGNWSDAYSASIILDTQASAVPVVNPAGTGYINTKTPTFTWNAADGAASYTIQYANNADFTSATLISGIAATTYTVAAALSDGAWFWRIKSVDAAGNESAWSATDSFTIDATVKRVPSEYSTIQAAIDAAVSGDTVLVSPGTYVENINFKGKNITVGSLFLTTGISSYIDSTIIDGNANGNPVVQFHSGETRDAILTGFTIQNGYTTANEWGAGIDIRGSGTQPTLRNLVIKNNNAQSGRGGGISLYYAGTPLVEKVKILNNICSDLGGGIYAFQSSLDLNEAVIAGNSAHSGSAINWNSALTLTIKNSLIYSNPSNIHGAIIFKGNTHNLYNTTIANNDGGVCKIGVVAGAGNTYLTNTIVSGHSGYNIDITSGMVFVDHSLIQGGAESIHTLYAASLKWNTGNLTADPLFVDPANGDYHLSADSPCIDKGTEVDAPATDLDGTIRPRGAGFDMGAYEAYLPVQLVAWSPGTTSQTTPTLDWNDVAGAVQYLLQYSRVSNFLEKVEVPGLTSSAYTIASALTDGDLFWRVAAFDADGKSGWWSRAEKITIVTEKPVTTANPVGGTFATAQSVTLTANKNATIYYTTDGSDPKTSATKIQYAGSPISINTTTTLKYYAIDTAGNESKVKWQRYIIIPDGWSSVALGGYHSLGIKSDGTLWEWGGDDPTDKTGTDTDWSAISAGYYYTLALKRDGTLWSWGYNEYGQLGDGTTNDRYNNPARIGSDTDWAAISTGYYHSLALKSDGSLWAWGRNVSGQLGDGTTTNKSSPTRVGADTDWAYISAGGWGHSLAIKSDGTLWAWGCNDSGQLGDGTTTSKTSPVKIGTDTDWVAVSGGYYYSLALKSDGTLWAWGYNQSGQLGNGTTNPTPTPVRIGTDTNWAVIEAGGDHSLAIKSDGTLWAWGNNGTGKLGDGTKVDKSSPVRIGTDTNWVSVAAEGSHSLGIRSDGTLWA